MWARYFEMGLAFWVCVSYWIFGTKNEGDFLIAAGIIIFAALSFIGKLNKMHLLQVIPAAWLFYEGFIYPEVPLPMELQNKVIIALSLLLFAVIPSRASEHPRPWQRFLENK